MNPGRLILKSGLLVLLTATGTLATGCKFRILGPTNQELAGGDSDQGSSGVPDPTALGDFAWSRAFDGWYTETARVLAMDSAGNPIVSGSFTNTIDFGGGGYNPGASNDSLYVAKYDRSNGALQWLRVYADQLTTGRPAPNDMAIDSSGNILIAGDAEMEDLHLGCGALTNSAGSRDAFLVKYDSSGNCLWSKMWGDTFSDAAFGVATSPIDASVVVAGRFIGNVDFGSGTPLSAATGNSHMFIAKYAADGTYQWARSWGGSGGDSASTVAFDPNGDVWFSALHTDSIDYGGGALVGSGTSADISLVKLDGTTGAHLFSVLFGSASADSPKKLRVGLEGNLYLTGSIGAAVDFGGGSIGGFGGSDIFVAKFSSSGAYLWSKAFGDASADEGASLVVDRWTNLILTGKFNGSVDFGGGALSAGGLDDVFVLKLGSDGAHRWSKAFGGTGNDQGHAVAVDSEGYSSIAGNYYNTINFGGGNHTSSNDLSAFLFQLKP